MALLWALKSIVVERASISRVAANLGTPWHTVNTAVVNAGRQLHIEQPNRCIIGADEHVLEHTPFGENYVDVVIGLTPVRNGRAPSRLRDTIPGRSKQEFTT